jgi:small subunit ribosomal protein S9
MAENKAVYLGTGRRKNARCARAPDAGHRCQITINKKPAADYFGREALVTFVETPFKATETTGRFDVIATIVGGGVSGQAGALRHGIARALLEAGDEYRGELKRAGLLRRDPVWSSARSTASRRPASARSSPSARPRGRTIDLDRGSPTWRAPCALTGGTA